MAGDEKRYFVALFTLRIATNGDATERKNLEFIVLWPDTSSATSCNRDYNKNYTQLALSLIVCHCHTTAVLFNSRQMLVASEQTFAPDNGTNS